jgi:translation initiation factor IF-3
LLDGNKAKVTIMFRGREVTHPDLGRKLLDRVANDLIEIGTIEQRPILEGRNMTMILVPNKAAAKIKAAGGAKGKSDKSSTVTEEKETLKAPLAESLKKEADEAAAPADEPLEQEKEKKTGEGTDNAEA